MPIKFRCQHCRQFLGISRSKAGGIVDCPTCGRSIRVPSLRGEREPIPEPKLDLNDSNLASALDQLASIGELESIDDANQQDGSAPASKPESIDGPLSPAPLPEPIAVAIPDPTDQIAPVIVELPPQSAPPTPVQSTNQSNTTEGVSEIIASLAPATEQGVGVRESQPVLTTHNASYRQQLAAPPVIASLISISILMFGLGYFFGTSSSTKTISTSNSSGQESPPSTAENSASETSAVRGRITYESDSDMKRVDEGACVIVLPQERTGTAKLALTGFRAADDPSDFAVAQASLKAIGGGVAKVGTEGTFELPLAKPGSYHILVLSHYQSRAESNTPNPQLVSTLSNYFERPDQLLGRLAYRFDELQYNGSETIPWDVSFEREE